MSNNGTFFYKYLIFVLPIFSLFACSKTSKTQSTNDSDSILTIDSASEKNQDSDTISAHNTDNDTSSTDSETSDSETSDTETSDTAHVSNPDADKLSGNETDPDINWISISAGSFTFGSPMDTPCSSASEKEVPVILTHPFMMAATEVTQSQWSALDYPNPSWEQGDKKPVTMINFYEALAWCNKLSKMEGLETCYNLSNCKNDVGLTCPIDETHTGDACSKDENGFYCSGNVHKYSNYYECPGYRLPTGVEWEYAAKAGTTTHTYNGDVTAGPIGACWDAQPSLDPIAWYCNNSDNHTHDVGLKTPNPWGLYDVLGNVAEWVDQYFTSYSLDNLTPGETLTDPIGPVTGDEVEYRGSQYESSGCVVRTANQAGIFSDAKQCVTGFRPVKTVVK